MTKPVARFIYKLNKWRNFILRPMTIGVRIILFNNSNVLLVKHTYLPGWYLPGGKVDKGENLQQAIKRELFEELNIQTVHIKDIHWAYSSILEYKNDHIVLFIGETDENPTISCYEIEKAQFFNLEDLPDDISPATKTRLDEFCQKIEKSAMW